MSLRIEYNMPAFTEYQLHTCSQPHTRCAKNLAPIMKWVNFSKTTYN